MNWITLNGIRSTDVKGLMIQSLPPVVKPKKRTSIETIDGRDGDIVTVLGYEAYDKECKIGLFGDFDIDQVISYFDSEGEVVFSNEKGKFYRYQILDEIEFSKLIRFREATVTFHVQPFKFSDVDRKKTFNPVGHSITITNRGNTFSKPVYHIKGSGMITLESVTIDMRTFGEITIDTEGLEAYQGDVLLNRYVYGSYDSLFLHSGENILTWSGDITEITLENFSRWI